MDTTVVQSPEFPSIFDPSTCTRKGLCPVTTIRKQDDDPLESHSLYFEQHGNGPEKIIFIMGMNSSSFSWSGQVEHFGHHPDYSVLVFDNRGVGNSGVPRGPYSTSGMAEDAITLLNYVGWTEERDLHVVSMSMGGMIALELASRIHDRIVSLTLAVTSSGGLRWANIAPLKGVLTQVKLLTTKDPDVKVPIVLDLVFPHPWLNEKAEDDPQGRTNLEVQKEHYIKRIAVTRPQAFFGAISQIAAVLTHNVEPKRLHQISVSIPKILILTGDRDNLVNPQNSVFLKEQMPEAEYIQWEGTGHVLHLQWPRRFSELLERTFKEGRERA